MVKISCIEVPVTIGGSDRYTRMEIDQNTVLEKYQLNHPDREILQVQLVDLYNIRDIEWWMLNITYREPAAHTSRIGRD